MDSVPLSASSINIYKMENEPLKQKCEMIQHKVQSMLAENFGLKEAAEKNKETIKFQAETIDTLQNDNKKLSIEITELKESFETDKARLEAENVLLQNSLKNAEKEKVDLIKCHVADERSLQNENARFQNSTNALQTSLSEKQEIINQQTVTIENNKTEISQLKETQEELQAKNTRLTKKVTSLQTSLKNAEKEKAELTKTYGVKEISFQNENTRLNNVIKSLQTSLVNSDTSNSQLLTAKNELQQKYDELYGVKNELNAKVCEQDKKIQKLEDVNRQMQNQISKLKVDVSNFIDAKRICRNIDVMVDGKIVYERLDGKILLGDKLEEFSYHKWYINDNVISFGQQNFQICTANHIIRSGIAEISKRFIYIILESLTLLGSEISYSEWKELISSCNNIRKLNINGVKVTGANGDVTETHQLWADISEEIPRIEDFTYVFKNGEGTSETAQKLSQVPSFFNLRKATLSNIQKGVRFEAFGKFMKKNPFANYYLYFSGSDEFYATIKNVERNLRQALPQTCELFVGRWQI